MFQWSARRDSNPRSLLGRQERYRYVTGAGVAGGIRTRSERFTASSATYTLRSPWFREKDSNLRDDFQRVAAYR